MILTPKKLSQALILLLFVLLLSVPGFNASAKAEDKYTLTVESGSGDGEYQAGEVVEIEADEAEEGQVFAGWGGDVEYVEDEGSESTSLTMPEGDVGVVASYEEGVSITVTWEDDQEPTPEGYYVHVGTQSGEYDRKIDAGSELSVTIDDLQKDQMYYITVTAYDMFGHESGPGEEVEIDPSQQND